VFLGLSSRSHRAANGHALIAGITFLVGLLAGVTLAPHASVHVVHPVERPAAHTSISSDTSVGQQSEFRAAHPAQVLRVIDGDTFEARVRVWPGHDITTKVRLRGIDAPELGTRCAGEFAKADAARIALMAILAEGMVGIARVAPDKYGGRVVADVSTRKTADVAAALLDGGVVRRYAGGRRESWC
jgi:endonuclease YncB( thermonuclease family)